MFIESPQKSLRESDCIVLARAAQELNYPQLLRVLDEEGCELALLDLAASALSIHCIPGNAQVFCLFAGGRGISGANTCHVQDQQRLNAAYEEWYTGHRRPIAPQTYAQAGYNCSLLAETGAGTSHTQDIEDNLLQNCVMQSLVHGILLISIV